jgi:hypothetical protein
MHSPRATSKGDQANRLVATSVLGGASQHRGENLRAAQGRP